MHHKKLQCFHVSGKNFTGNKKFQGNIYLKPEESHEHKQLCIVNNVMSPYDLYGILSGFSFFVNNFSNNINNSIPEASPARLIPFGRFLSFCNSFNSSSLKRKSKKPNCYTTRLNQISLTSGQIYRQTTNGLILIHQSQTLAIYVYMQAQMKTVNIH